MIADTPALCQEFLFQDVDIKLSQVQPYGIIVHCIISATYSHQYRKNRCWAIGP